jgi:nicotinamide-nucleotide amidase
MRAHVLSIGSELLLGHLTDTNATFLAQELVVQGIELIQVTQVGDELDRIVAALRAAAAGAELVICTGGVGPTEDDLTREALAAVAGEEPRVDPALLATLERFFASRGQTMPARNAKQAWLIPSAEALPNPVGTAPGWFVRHGSAVFVAMPGVPREMFRMWREQALPRIAENLTRRDVSTVTFRTIGIGESMAEQILGDLVAKPNPVVATYAKDDGVHVRVSGFGDTAEEAAATRDRAAAEVRRLLGEHIYADTDIPLPAVILGLLRDRDLTLGVVEHGSAGRLSNLLGGTPDAAGTLLGGLALPLAVPTTTAPDQAAVAADARERFGADIGLGLVIEAAPEGTVPGIFVGTVGVALAGAVSAAETHQTRAAFEEIHRRAALTAVDVLRRAVARTA